MLDIYLWVRVTHLSLLGLYLPFFLSTIFLPHCLSCFVPGRRSLFISPVASEEDDLWTAVVLPACHELRRAAVLLAFIDNITQADVNMTLPAATLPAPSCSLRQPNTNLGLESFCVCVCRWMNLTCTSESKRGGQGKIHCVSGFVCVSLPDPRTLLPKVEAQRQATCSLQETWSWDPTW